MARTKLNERQLDVLRRICRGATPVTSEESSLAATVYALRNRGLVTTTRAEGRWTAAPTDAGRQYLAQNDPAPAPGREASSTLTAPEASELITRLQQAGGTLSITDPTPPERARWRRALHSARAEKILPDGHHLHYTGRDKGDLVITLRPGPQPTRTTQAAQAIPVPDDLRRDCLHSVVQEARIPVCPDCQPRARRILHALCLAAEDKNYTISSPASDSTATLVITPARVPFQCSFRKAPTRFLIRAA
ncbi:hypothetical protein ACSNOJ_22215 [Streptomyces sp. URMC 128]|uniref:hypothetical protein n=1 Tax=Streptomyces sp. URMC 128 TaxID=3423404 RepID=UPI003F1C6A25